MFAGWFGLIDLSVIVALLLYRATDRLTTALLSLIFIATFGAVMLV